ncbi:MAG: family 20 glycosylhydrolase [Planctomycetota bacterium]|nr:family 20 glycosylhydrolase [Planctomycetota bacterium]
MRSRLLALALLCPTAAAQFVPAVEEVSWRFAEPVVGELVATEEAAFTPQAEVLVQALRSLGVPGAAVQVGGTGPADDSVRPIDGANDADAPGPASTPAVAATLRLTRDDSLGPEAYTVQHTGEALVIAASTPAGAARAAATLAQAVQVEDGRASWPRLTISDAPQLPYRCFMVDMGRNPHSPETLRAVVDMVWFYKGNLLQLHLTDDQLFSWPSRAFPKLYSERAGWTWQDFVELEAYAAARGVAILPELDVPGHSTILRREYPEVFGTSPTDLASTPEAQAGVETLIAELLEVFTSTPYVHIGGDEAYGVPQNIQRDFINRLDAFVRAKGKRTVVWEGPRLGVGDNKVDERVLQINWRGSDFPAQDMLDAGYEVINASWDPMYIVDHYPRTMFTAVEVERCYDWNPRRFAHINHGMPTFGEGHITKSDEGILGFCMPWWEGREENLLVLCLPRFAAASSAAWNREGESDFADFQARQRLAIPRFEAIAGVDLPEMPFADPATQGPNFAYRGPVSVSDGASQPHFGPARLTNGLTDRLDHFLGFPTQPEPLEIVVELLHPAPAPPTVGRVVVHEAAVNGSYELYELLISADGIHYDSIGTTTEGTRGENAFVEFAFEQRPVSHVKLLTQGCHNLTFPSFSRLTEIQAFAE